MLEQIQLSLQIPVAQDLVNQLFAPKQQPNFLANLYGYHL